MSVTVQAIPQDRSATTLKDVSEFFVPNILAFKLKKTPENQLQAAETDNPSNRQNGDIVTEEDEGPKMSPRRKGSVRSSQQTSSFLLEPFLKPVAHHVESSKENPVLKALFGGRTPPGLSPWTYLTRTSLNNCHPFKKTEFSHDLNNDDTPVQVPKSLTRSPKIRKRDSSPEPKTTVLKEVAMNLVASVTSASVVSLSESTPNLKSGTPGWDKSLKERNSVELSILNKRKKIISQATITTPKPRLQYINSDRLIQLRTIVDNAIKSHKVYSMTGCYNAVRNALKQRGWIEKIDSDVKGRRKVNKYEEIGLCKQSCIQSCEGKVFVSTPLSVRIAAPPPISYALWDGDGLIAVKYQTVAAMRLSMQTNSGFAQNDQIRYTGPGEAEIINRMLRNVTEDLCWLSRPYPYYCWKDFDKFEMVNRLPRAYFSNKVGLCNSLQQIQWFYETGVCSTQFPRTYNMSTKDEMDAFRDDYRLTACVNILKWFVQTYKTGGEKAVRSADGKIDTNVIEFALRRCAEFVKTKQHEDIDISEMPTVWEYQWDQFISQYYKIINEGQILKDSKDGVSIKALISNVQSMLNILKPYWPQFDIDGYQNFWIVKPGGRCCGAGIVIKNNLEQILVMVNPNSMKESRFVVQKYIERPLLIYNTKFDIRQWFLVTSVYPLTIWMYKESYLRFCSQPFSLKNTHESIHLCNNAVQRKYKNGKRDKGLPDENMWDCYTFQTYLKAIGHPDAWEKHIYPGMREGFIGALLASQDTMERKKNCFELYGADFMISDTLSDGPWLIEINSNPAMDSSTSVTARLCPQVLEDIIKVVIDRRDNKSAPTGAFEMVFRQNCPPIPPYLGMSLCIKGKKAYRSSGDYKSLSRKSKSKKVSQCVPYTDTEEESTVEEIISVNTSSSAPVTPKKDLSSTSETNPSKFGDPDSAKDKRSKRKSVDWVRKNIEDLRSVNSAKQTKTPSEDFSSSPRLRSADESFRDQALKMLSTMDVKDFIREVIKLKKDKDELVRSKQQKEMELLVGQIEEKVETDRMSEKTAGFLKDFLKVFLKDMDKKVIDWTATLKELKESCGLKSKLTTKSCPNFDFEFERELQRLEENSENCHERSKSEESFESYFSAQSHITGSNSKNSLDYFREWKTELYDTCEDFLVQLKSFDQVTAKEDMQKAIERQRNSEMDFLKRVRQRKKCKKLDRSKIKAERREDRVEKCREEKNRWGSEVWKGKLAPLAINSENGAVRNVIYSLPKIKKRSRMLSTKKSRKINQSLPETCCY